MNETQTTPTLEELAREASSWFETATRDGSDAPYVRTKDGRPDWLETLIFEAHGDFLPEDWRYACIADALEHIGDGGDPDDGHDFADQHVDVYTGARLAWLASNLNRPGYCDQAQDEGLAPEDAGVVELAGVGQYVEALEVFGIVATQLEERRGELEEEAADD